MGGATWPGSPAHASMMPRRTSGTRWRGVGVSCGGSDVGFVRSGFVQIGGAWLVGVAGCPHEHTQTLDSFSML